jgi:hypothetical protein
MLSRQPEEPPDRKNDFGNGFSGRVIECPETGKPVMLVRCTLLSRFGLVDSPEDRPGPRQTDSVSDTVSGLSWPKKRENAPRSGVEVARNADPWSSRAKKALPCNCDEWEGQAVCDGFVLFPGPFPALGVEKEEGALSGDRPHGRRRQSRSVFAAGVRNGGAGVFFGWMQ